MGSRVETRSFATVIEGGRLVVNSVVWWWERGRRRLRDESFRLSKSTMALLFISFCLTMTRSYRYTGYTKEDCNKSDQKELEISMARNQRVIMAIMCARNQMSMMSGEMPLYLAHQYIMLT
jgi:hypothetical protein